MTDASNDWDPEAIVVVPGLPGELSQPSGDRPIYPASTLAFVKVLRRDGLPVRLAAQEFREVSHHAADEWLPIVNFGLQVLAGGGGNLLSGVLLSTFGPGPRRRTVAHVRWNVQARDGSVHEFAYDGDPEGAIETARLFERSLGYGADEG